MPRPITPLLLAGLLAGFTFASQAQNCPKVLACPTGNTIFCDFTDNDSTLWNSPEFSWSPWLQSPDLAEGSVELSLALRDTCPGALKINFTLFLDLDGDNLAESVATSTPALPPGKMLFSNAFNPGYSGADTLVFDGRAVADSFKFRFAVQTQQNGDTLRAFLRWTTGQSPAPFIVPRLPEGKHRIFWMVEKNNTPAAFCEQAFRVKDCMEPQVECIPGWNASLPAGGDTLWLTVADFLAASSDNITPKPLLSYGLRRLGAGSGFPINSQGAPVARLPFTCADLGAQFVELWARDLSDNLHFCTAEFALFDFLKTCNKVDPIVCATTVFLNDDTLQNVRYEMQVIEEPGLPPVQLGYTKLPNGCIELPDFSPYFIETVGITPRKTDDPLNGVSTYDLVLINRHILGNQIFDRTWKYLAADANNSGSLTTFDIIELRKLILGIYDSLPNSSSWKFYIADCALDSLHPLQYVCPGTLVFDPQHPPGQYLFRSIKTGDVNGNANSGSQALPAPHRTTQALRLPDLSLAAGEPFDLELRPVQAAEWLGSQWELQWDPQALELAAAEPVVAGGSGACALLGSGRLRCNWFDATARWLFPETPLLRLKGRALRPLLLRENLQLAANALAPEAYAADGAAVPLELQFEFFKKTAEREQIYAPQPNPTRAGAVFPLNLEQAAEAVLELWDPAGRAVFSSRELLAGGAGQIALPEAQLVSPGVYVWRVQVGNTTKTGRLVRW